jgi:glycogen operon protein
MMSPRKAHHLAAKVQGAVWNGQGVDFSLYSLHAEGVELCLYNTNGEETSRIPLEAGHDKVWRVYVPGAEPGQHYGYRVSGPYLPHEGYRFNAAKLLLDPYAYRVSGTVQWQPQVYGYQIGEGTATGYVQNSQDSAPWVPKSVVIDRGFDWEDDKTPAVPMGDSIIYELHVKGFTKRHPDVPPEVQGTYLGLAAPAVIEYLQRLGVTAVELLPVATALTDQRLFELGLTNYWGYDPIALFAPDARFALNDPVTEFKTMVKALHKAGLEVILDVVFNHTGEGNELGPTVMFRGIDNAVYYRPDPENAARYCDTTGCGNSIQVEHPQVLELVLDCLRYWVTDMHVDGFRFDLATTVARENGEFAYNGKFFQRIKADPVLSRVKMIAEPWDLGYGGYRLGQFPKGWSEWNDRYRDTVRGYWRGDDSMLPELARRFSGSADMFSHNRRRPDASVNFISAHDGFTLRDTVSYNEKHNEDNGEGNRDGHNHNLSFNYGAEGAADDPAINTIRARQQRNMLATLLLSHGVPMMLAGDEINRTQQGNNNAYCQDNELNWVDWTLDSDARDLLEFVRLLIDLRKQHPVFRTQKFLKGRLNVQLGYRDVEWLRPDGLPMASKDWQSHYARCITILLTADHDLKAAGEPHHFVLLLNSADHPVECVLPTPPEDGTWMLMFDTQYWPVDRNEKVEGANYVCQARSFVLMKEVSRDEQHGD